MHIIISKGKAYSEEEWILKLEKEKEEQRMKVPQYEKCCKELEKLEDPNIRHKLDNLAKFACDFNYVKIFNSLEYLSLQSQILCKTSNFKDFEVFVDGLVALAEFQKNYKAFNEKSINKIFKETVFKGKRKKISEQSIENIKWFHFKGEKGNQLIDRLLL